MHDWQKGFDHPTYRWKENLYNFRPLRHGMLQALSADQVYRFRKICQGILNNPVDT
jgi:hypothetical protein